MFSEAMAAGQVHGKTVANLVTELVRFVRPRGLGTLVASDSGVLLERDPDTVREPDVAFTPAERLPPGSEVEGYAGVIPDLVAEVASRGDSRYEVYDKARMLLGHGVRLVRVVNPRTRTVRVHHPDLRL